MSFVYILAVLLTITRPLFARVIRLFKRVLLRIFEKILLISSIVAYKEGIPGDLELDKLAGNICKKWQELGLRLGISQDKLDEIDANENRKAYLMLLHWRNTTASATLYRDLYHALCDSGVGHNNVAKEFCGKKN